MQPRGDTFVEESRSKPEVETAVIDKEINSSFSLKSTAPSTFTSISTSTSSHTVENTAKSSPNSRQSIAEKFSPKNLLSLRPPKTHSTVPTVDTEEESAAAEIVSNVSDSDPPATLSELSSASVDDVIRCSDSLGTQEEASTFDNPEEVNTHRDTNTQNETVNRNDTTNPGDPTSLHDVIAQDKPDDVTSSDDVISSDDVTSLALNLADLIIEDEEEPKCVEQKTVCQREVRLEPLPNRNVS